MTRTHKNSLFTLIALLAASLACSLAELPAPIQQTPDAVSPSSAPQVIQATATRPVPTAETLVEPASAPETTAPSQPLPELVEIALFDSQNGWGRSETSLYTTSNGGQTWQEIATPWFGNGTYFSATFLDPQTAHIVSTNPENPASLLNITSDGGRTWQQIPLTSDSPYFSAKTIPSGSGTLFLFENLGAAAGSMGVAISVSQDGGQTWERTFAHVPGETEGASLPFGGQKSLPAFLDAQLGFIGGSRPVENDIYFYRSQDAGRSWQAQALPVPASISNYMAMTQSPLTFTGNSQDILVPVLFSLSEGSQFIFFSSATRGQAWQASAPLAKAETYEFINLQTGWVWAEGSLLFTGDGGQTWQNLAHNLPPNTSLRQIDFIDPQNGWALAFDLDFKTHLYATGDSGQTWVELAP